MSFTECRTCKLFDWTSRHVCPPESEYMVKGWEVFPRCDLPTFSIVARSGRDAAIKYAEMLESGSIRKFDTIEIRVAGERGPVQVFGCEAYRQVSYQLEEMVV